MVMPLRPDLYQRLDSHLGPVLIANEGVALRGHTEKVGGTYQLQVDVKGEEYRIRCPFCKESRYRLYINHLWGKYVPELKSDNLHLAHCFNEDCLSDWGRVLKLRDWVYNDVIRGRFPDPVRQGLQVAPVSQQAVPPGVCINMAHLPGGHPMHTYIRQRGQDPIYLGKEFSVGLVHLADPQFMMAQDRLYIPIMCNGEFVGWQARWPSDPVPHGVPKYYSMPGMRTGQCLYNYDQARRFPFVVICEGPTDVWSFGPEAVALFGKNMSQQQAEMISAGVSRNSSGPQGLANWKTAVLLLDVDAFVSGAKGVSAVDKVTKRLSQIRNLKCVVVRLRHHNDPGSFDTEYLRAFVAARCEEQGVKLPI